MMGDELKRVDVLRARMAVFTGSRAWRDTECVTCLLDWMRDINPDLVLVDGGCLTGLDQIVRDAGSRMGFYALTMSARWDRYGKAAGPFRNGKMLDLEPDFVCAFHENWEASKGTKDCVEQAKERGIPVHFWGWP